MKNPYEEPDHHSGKARWLVRSMARIPLEAQSARFFLLGMYRQQWEGMSFNIKYLDWTYTFGSYKLFLAKIKQQRNYNINYIGQLGFSIEISCNSSLVELIN